MLRSQAASFIQDVLLLDGTPALNLADFATTYMEYEIEAPMLKKTAISPALWNLGWLVAEDEDKPGGIPTLRAVPTWRVQRGPTWHLSAGKVVCVSQIALPSPLRFQTCSLLASVLMSTFYIL